MLLIDAGNSRCKWAYVDQGSWARRGVLENTDEAAWRDLHDIFASLKDPGKVVVSNVAGALVKQQILKVCSVWQHKPDFISAQNEQCGVRNGYAQFDQLGSDRWAALIAARRYTPMASLVVNCGTATTVDALTSEGKFLGGLILPGVELMQSSLLQKAARLDYASGSVTDFPICTSDAMASGAVYATIGAIRHQYGLLRAKYNNVCCIISGGAAGMVENRLEIEVIRLDDLVLQGLHIIGNDCSNENIN